MPPMETNESKDMFASGDVKSTANQPKTADDDYTSCPPPSGPPPPPPQLENDGKRVSNTSKSHQKRSEPKVQPVNTSNPPPIPSRPRPPVPQGLSDQPPPLPARTSLMSSPSASPRKTAE